MKKILLLDDDLDIVQIVEEVLAYEQYKVKSSMQCTGFLSTAEHFQPDVILLDYRLADGSGGELCRTIKSHPTLHNIPVIIFSAYTQPGLDFNVYGCDAIIAKPFDLDNLVETINNLIMKKIKKNHTLSMERRPSN
jgi:CheY-like chemotaxis protein